MKKLVSLLLAALLLAALVPMPALAADAGARYLVEGGTESGDFVVRIQAPDLDAISGAISLSYDTSMLTLQGGDSFAAIQKGAGVSLTTDGVDEDELVNAANGTVGFAWYAHSLTNGLVATLRFSFVDGCTEDDLDAASLRLRYVPAEGFGSWISAAKLRERTTGVTPNYYSYLNDAERPLSITFDYPGSDEKPAAARSVVVHCRNALGKAVRAEMEINNTSYTTNAAGDLYLPLVDGDYLYRLAASGYGTEKGTLTVSGDAEQTMTFTTDAELVEQAREALEITFAEGDSAEAVTQPLGLITKTESGVAVSWTSSVPARVGSQGSVFRPPHGSGDVTVELTATLTHGSASAKKQFTVTVLELGLAEVPGVPTDTSSTGSTGTSETGGGVFSDVGASSYAWAQEAVEALAEAGIIKGTGNGKFSPAAQIKRADFLLMLARMFQVDADLSGVREFQDVPAGSYYHDAVLTARALGVTDGAGGNRFLPASYITRQEMAVLTVRMLNCTGSISFQEEDRIDLNGTFSDGAQSAAWARDSLSLLAGRGFLVGSGGALTPTANTNRAQAAVFLYRIYQEAGR